MPYRTILLYMSDERRVEELVDVAVPIASRRAAHLTGVCIAPTGDAPTSSRAAFEREMAARGSPGRWDAVELATTAPSRLADAVIEHGRTADLVVCGQADEDWDLHSVLDFPDRLVLETGRPTLIVPVAGRYPRVGRRVVVAWNASREGARAVFDALPMLEDADAVSLLRIGADRTGSGPDLSSSALVAALSRHGVDCEALQVTSSGAIGEALLQSVTELGADLLVMGCYGRSRAREYVLGGASRDILRGMHIPVLMSH